jgi:hypothetical protein
MEKQSTSLSHPADLTLAGTKGKIAQIGSAPTLPEEHVGSQESRVQLSHFPLLDSVLFLATTI